MPDKQKTKFSVCSAHQFIFKYHHFFDDNMRNKKHIMYTHRMCVCLVKSSDSAVAHGASQCFASFATALSEDLTTQTHIR